MNPTTYSFQDLTGAIVHPSVGVFVFTGDKMGIGEVVVSMMTEKTVMDTSADGGVMMSWIPGDAGTITFVMQQTCLFHKWLLNTFNVIKTGPVNLRFAMAATLRNVTDGSTHECNGIGWSKIPDKTYQAQGQRITWSMPCADIQSLNA